MTTVPLRWDGTRLTVLDQTALPFAERELVLADADAVAGAIARLAVRGAPLIGIAAAYGLAMAVAAGDDLDRAAATLRAARPTAVNLAWAVDRVAAAARAGGAGPAAAAQAEAERIHAAEDAASDAIAEAGAALLRDAGTVLTHCNTGALAAGGRGTALAVVLALPNARVLATETRPLLQGARLTAWELRRAGRDHELVVDGAAPGLIARGEVDAVITGCDRVAANGDVANKVGTYPLALAAQAAGIPFVVAGPTSSIDPATPTGAGIVIEERAAEEVRTAAGVAIAPPGTPVRNPAFDVTPAALVTALVTERGVARPVSPASLRALLDAPDAR
ncbi:MAG TPA: S-methyl-5-thioribose-1-phosphate isomerase [Solirubrobacteraceae bacterium]|jgi:methylthioribose-1-phosphate isomerase|nr:S-methyl-5-thioribose-1-phosphate isomerase [Solirubrobacteraceae bacterium]